MNTSRSWMVVSAAIVVAAAVYAAETPAGRAANPAAKQGPGRGTGKSVLPDPALLDGSAQQADKQSEHGMLGEFEIPGDENVRNDRVGGQGDPNTAQDPNILQNGGSPMGTRPDGQPGGAGGTPGGPESPQGQMANAAGGGAQQGPQGQMGGANGDPNATAQGIQVAELQGEPQGGTPGDMPQKPPAVAIGDSAMQIQGVPNAPTDVVGTQVAGQTQQMEKAIGGGGKGASGNNGNRGAEKGRVIPAGL